VRVAHRTAQQINAEMAAAEAAEWAKHPLLWQPWDFPTAAEWNTGWHLRPGAEERRTKISAALMGNEMTPEAIEKRRATCWARRVIPICGHPRRPHKGMGCCDPCRSILKRGSPERIAKLLATMNGRGMRKAGTYVLNWPEATIGTAPENPEMIYDRAKRAAALRRARRAAVKMFGYRWREIPSALPSYRR